LATATAGPTGFVGSYFGAGETRFLPVSQVPWDLITHVFYAFVITTPEGTLSNAFPDVLTDLAQQAQANGVNLVLSIGGYGRGSEYFPVSVEDAEAVSLFASTILQYVDQYNATGVDIGNFQPMISI
jgi:chitinase